MVLLVQIGAGVRLMLVVLLSNAGFASIAGVATIARVAIGGAVEDGNAGVEPPQYHALGRSECPHLTQGGWFSPPLPQERMGFSLQPGSVVFHLTGQMGQPLHHIAPWR